MFTCQRQPQTQRDESLPDREMPYMHIVTGTNRQYRVSAPCCPTPPTQFAKALCKVNRPPLMGPCLPLAHSVLAFLLRTRSYPKPPLRAKMGRTRCGISSCQAWAKCERGHQQQQYVSRRQRRLTSTLFASVFSLAVMQAGERKGEAGWLPWRTGAVM
jgi:hypothetical protein